MYSDKEFTDPEKNQEFVKIRSDTEFPKLLVLWNNFFVGFFSFCLTILYLPERIIFMLATCINEFVRVELGKNF